eukprot:g1034.t1
MRLHFICPYTLQIVDCGPNGRGYEIERARRWVKDNAKIVGIGVFTVRLALAAGRAVGVPLPSLSYTDVVPDTEGILQKVTATAQQGVLDELIKEAGDVEVPACPVADTDKLQQQTQTLRGADLKLLKLWLDKNHEDWESSVGMVQAANSTGLVEWISAANVEAWKEGQEASVEETKGSHDGDCGGDGGGDVDDDVATQQEVLAGMLQKKASSGIVGAITTLWQPRYFAIRGHWLVYAHTEEALKQGAKGTINLHQACQCTVEGLVIQITGDASTNLQLQAKEPDEAQLWHMQISKKIAERQVAAMTSLEHFAPRKGTFALARARTRSRNNAPQSESTGSTQPVTQTASSTKDDPSADDVRDWTAEDVAKYVAGLGNSFGGYRQKLIDNCVHGRIFLGITDDDLQGMGIENKLHRKVLLTEVEDIKVKRPGRGGQ